MTINTDLITTALEGVVLVSAALGTVYKWVVKPLVKKFEQLMKPIEALQDAVEQHSEQIEKGEFRLNQLDKVAEYNTELLIEDTKMLLATMKHLRTGNNTGTMDELIEKVEVWMLENNNPMND